MGERKLDSLVLLRAIAVVAVCCCHYGHPLEAKNGLGKLFYIFHEYGKYGVHVFFVVSGFVIPLSLHRSQYIPSNYFTFLLKRFVRLHPPYLTALFLTIVLSYFSYKARGVAYPETAESIIKSLFYFHAPADNPVFWTLAVEAQYYIFIGIVYELIVRFPRFFLIVATPILIQSSQSFITQYVSFFAYVLFFLVGIVGFMIYNKIGPIILNYIGIIFLLAASFLYDDIPSVLAASFTIIMILIYKRSISELSKFYGEISYSLYLIHFPIGIKLINLASRYIDPSYNWLVFILTMVVITAISWVFYRLVEKPSAQLSNKIKYKTQLLHSPSSIA